MEVERTTGQVPETNLQAWPKVAIIILNWNGWRETIRCLKELRKLTYPNYDITVVDNGSTDDSLTMLEAYKRSGQSFRLLPLRENMGYTGGINAAIKYIISQDSACEFVFLLNPDTRHDQYVLDECVKVALLQDCPCVGAVIMEHGDKVRAAAGAKFPHLLFFSHSLPVKEGCDFWEVDLIHGAAMLLRRDVLEYSLNSRGYILDPALFLYGDEIEFCSWLRSKGYRIMIAGRAIVYHYSSRRSILRQAISYYYVTRNHILLASRLLPRSLRVMFHIWYPISRVMRTVLLLVKGQYACSLAVLLGLIDGYKSKTGKWARHDDLERNLIERVWLVRGASL